jgi:hypothetical protein
MTLALATAHLASLTTHLSVFLDATSALSGQVKTLALNAITVLKFLLPLIAVFRIVYRFAETREGNLTVLIAEIVIIVFVALVLGSALQALINGL